MTPIQISAITSHSSWFLSQALIYRWMHFSHTVTNFFHNIFDRKQQNDWQEKRPSVNRGGRQHKWCITLLSNLWAKSDRALQNRNKAELKIGYSAFVQSISAHEFIKVSSCYLNKREEFWWSLINSSQAANHSFLDFNLYLNQSPVAIADLWHKEKSHGRILNTFPIKKKKKKHQCIQIFSHKQIHREKLFLQTDSPNSTKKNELFMTTGKLHTYAEFIKQIRSF